MNNFFPRLSRSLCGRLFAVVPTSQKLVPFQGNCPVYNYDAKWAEEQIKAVQHAADKAGIPLDDLDMKLLRIIGRNLLWINQNAEMIKKEKPIVSLGWEAEFISEGHDDWFVLRQFSSYVRRHGNEMVKTIVDGADASRSPVFEIIGQPMSAFDTLLSRYCFTKEMRQKNINLTRFSEHLHIGLTGPNGNLYKKDGENLYNSVGDGIRLLMSESLPCLATGAQINGREGTSITCVLANRGSKCVTKAHILKEHDGTSLFGLRENPHHEVRRVMPGSQSPFEPYIVALAIATSGMVYGIENLYGDIPEPVISQINERPLLEQIEAMLESERVCKYLGRDVVCALAQRIIDTNEATLPKGFARSLQL